MADVKFVIKGVSPLVMNNGEKADPDGEYADKAAGLKNKRNKSPEERSELAQLEWRCGLYFHDKLGPCIPDQNIIACLVKGAAPQKLGGEVDAYVSVSEPFVKLNYTGPRDIDGMWKAGMFDRRLVSGNGKPGGPKVVRYRPLFKDWSLSFNLYVDDEIDPKAMVEAMRHAGRRVGLCERRKFRWGRFEIVEAGVGKK